MSLHHIAAAPRHVPGPVSKNLGCTRTWTSLPAAREDQPIVNGAIDPTGVNAVCEGVYLGELLNNLTFEVSGPWLACGPLDQLAIRKSEAVIWNSKPRRFEGQDEMSAKP